MGRNRLDYTQFGYCPTCGYLPRYRENKANGITICHNNHLYDNNEFDYYNNQSGEHSEWIISGIGLVHFRKSLTQEEATKIVDQIRQVVFMSPYYKGMLK